MHRSSDPSNWEWDSEVNGYRPTMELIAKDLGRPLPDTGRGYQPWLVKRMMKAWAKKMFPEAFTKKCSRCGEEKPLTEYYRAKNSSLSDSRRTDCKSCHSAYAAKQNREQRAAAKEAALEARTYS